MTNERHIPADMNASIACDLSSAEDTGEERLREYAKLFGKSLRERERTPGAIRLSFEDAEGIRAWVEDLTRREAACCPFLDFRIETDNGFVHWTITNARTGTEGAQIESFLDALHDHAVRSEEGMEGLMERMAEQGVPMVETDSGYDFQR